MTLRFPARVRLAVLATVALAAPGRAAIYYVSADSGSDTNDGGAGDRAFQTLQKAHDASLPGDTINVMKGTYLAPALAARTDSLLLDAGPAGVVTSDSDGTPRGDRPDLGAFEFRNNPPETPTHGPR